MGIGLGIGLGHAPKSEPALWLLQDEFATDLAAGSVNGTAAEPGPGTRVVSSPAGGISISEGKLILNPLGAWSEAFGYTSASDFACIAGRLVVLSAEANSTHEAAFSTGVGSHTGILWPGVRTWGPPTSILDTAQLPLNQQVLYIFALRLSGMFWFIKLLGQPWRLLFCRSHTNPATMNPSLAAATTRIKADFIRVPNALWLPTPLASDGFGSAFGTTDGLGHAEGVAGGIGSGGSGKTWSNVGGTWSVSGGKAINTAPSGLAQQISVASLGVADVFAGVAMVRALSQQVGLALNVDNASSPQNGVLVYSDGAGNIKVDKIVSGVQSNVRTTAVTYSAGARLVIAKNGSEYRVYYNNALVGAANTISDAGIVSNTLHGLFSTDASNTLDDFVCYATGTGGEYAELDKWS